MFNKGKPNPNQPSSSLESEYKSKEKLKEQIPCKEPMDRGENVNEVRPPAPVEVEKVTPIFNLQTKLSKVKISVPFNELLRNKEYMDKITGMVKGQGYFQLDILEVNDDAPTISFGTRIENGDEEEVPPF